MKKSSVFTTLTESSKFHIIYEGILGKCGFDGLTMKLRFFSLFVFLNQNLFSLPTVFDLFSKLVLDLAKKIHLRKSKKYGHFDYN